LKNSWGVAQPKWHINGNDIYHIESQRQFLVSLIHKLGFGKILSPSQT